jgi:hypothetical protein
MRPGDLGGHSTEPRRPGDRLSNQRRTEVPCSPYVWRLLNRIILCMETFESSCIFQKPRLSLNSHSNPTTCQCIRKHECGFHVKNTSISMLCGCEMDRGLSSRNKWGGGGGGAPHLVFGDHVCPPLCYLPSLS